MQTPAYQTGMEARFAVAARHSRMVRILRIAIPTIVVLAMAALVAIATFNPFRVLKGLPLDMGKLVVSGTKITMESPHLSGFSPDQRPYELWAKTATQDVTDPDHVDLNTLRAKVVMEDQSIVTLDANQGLFDTKAQVLDLRKDIFLQSSTGYEARLTRALVDIAKGSVSSDEPVDVKLLNGTLKSQRLRIIDKGDVVRFEGGVSMVLVMDQPPAAAPEQPDDESTGAAPAPTPSPASSASSEPSTTTHPSRRGRAKAK